MNEITTLINNCDLPKTKSEFIVAAFNEYFQKLTKYEENAKEVIINDETSTDKLIELTKEARIQRIELKNLRVGVEKTRKGLKEQVVREGKAIDGIANVIKAIIVPIEGYLETQEKYNELKEAKRKDEINEKRIIKLTPYVEDVSIYQLRDMTDEAFSLLLETSKKAYNAQKTAERKVSEEQEKRACEERKRQEEIRLENIRLKAEREAREKELQAEREKQEKEKIKQENILKAEREAREKIEAKVKEEKKEKELKEKQKMELKRQELLAPDKQKLLTFAVTFDKIEYPSVAMREAGKIIDNVQEMVNKISFYIREQSKKI